MALIELSCINKIYRMGQEAIHALDEVTLSIKHGEMVSITGPSGCGKSTLMNIIGLLDVPDSGKYQLETREVSTIEDDERARLRNEMIGFVFQNFNLLPRLSAIRNVEMPLIYTARQEKRLSVQAIRHRADDALKSVALGDRKHHQPNELSGGERQRVAIARALVNRPKLLLADEPTGNLDSKAGESILELFLDLNLSGVTLIIVTHDPKVAQNSPRVLTMLDGKIQSDTRRDE